MVFHEITVLFGGFGIVKFDTLILKLLKQVLESFVEINGLIKVLAVLLLELQESAKDLRVFVKLPIYRDIKFLENTRNFYFDVINIIGVKSNRVLTGHAVVVLFA